MVEIQVTSEIITLVITAMTSLGATLPFVAKFKAKLTQTRSLIIAIEEALADDKVTKAELKIIARYAGELVGSKTKEDRERMFTPGE